MRFFGKLATALLLLVYLGAFVGFRLHECSVDQTVEVLSLLAGESCEQVHHHHCSDGDNCGHHHHHCAEEHDAQRHSGAGLQICEADCCANSVYCLSDSQIASEGGGDHAAVKCMPAVEAVVTACCATPHLGEGFKQSYCVAHCPVSGSGVLALYSVRRV